METSRCRVWFPRETRTSLKSYIFRDITPCSPLKVNGRFREACRHLLQNRIITKPRNQRECRWQAEQALPEDVDDMLLRNVS
jgi:hypothetical protein